MKKPKLSNSSSNSTNSRNESPNRFVHSYPNRTYDNRNVSPTRFRNQQTQFNNRGHGAPANNTQVHPSNRPYVPPHQRGQGMRNFHDGNRSFTPFRSNTLYNNRFTEQRNQNFPQIRSRNNGGDGDGYWRNITVYENGRPKTISAWVPYSN